MNEEMRFSVVIPVHNEEENIAPLLLEIQRAIRGPDSFEVIVADDHSTDQTYSIVQQQAKQFPWLRIVRLRQQSGQSAALRCGIKKAEASLIVTLDGDGQNDPGDIEKLVKLYNEKKKAHPCCLINGYRARRKDSGWRRFSSVLANAVRQLLLRDATPDSGCGIKVYAKETFLDLPPFDHMHRFLPALVRQQGGEVVSVEVNHRPRKAGKSHYGIIDRLFAGIIDLLGVLWLGRRAFPVGLIEEEHHE